MCLSKSLFIYLFVSLYLSAVSSYKSIKSSASVIYLSQGPSRDILQSGKSAPKFPPFPNVHLPACPLPVHLRNFCCLFSAYLPAYLYVHSMPAYPPAAYLLFACLYICPRPACLSTACPLALLLPALCLPACLPTYPLSATCRVLAYSGLSILQPLFR